MSEAYKKLIKTLQTIFEMDKADLDFGIYRLMNQKRDEINQFLENDLLPHVKDTFADYATGSQSELKKELQSALEQAREFDAPDPENAPAVLKIKGKMASSVDITAVENEVYFHLHTFFSRYYNKGDFISQRRYKKDAYAIPYEGEEVKIYWANQDQYYIKSSEYLRDYAFIVEADGEKSVRIKLVEADTEKDNVKAKIGEERRFILDKDNPLAVENGELSIRFQYIAVGKKKQEKLNEEAVETIFRQEGFDEWLELLKNKSPTEKNPDRTLLEKHLNDYTARNTFDYFIHKNLGGFLRRELDFYIKNEVLHLDDIDDAAFDVTDQHLRKIKVIRTIAHKLIRLLAQLEDFQKTLWLKQKFIVENNYCITLDRVPDELYEKILICDAQWQEWVELGFIEKDNGSPEIRKAVLSSKTKLMIDTCHYSTDFKEALISGIHDLDVQTNGLLINANNYQAIGLLSEQLYQAVDYVYLDPPFNTNEATFTYKNEFRHSSWSSMMANLLQRSKGLLSESGIISSAIDDQELHNLGGIFREVFGEDGYLGNLVVEIKPSGRTNDYFLSTSHEYNIFYSNNAGNVDISFFPLTDESVEAYSEHDEMSAYKWRDFLRTGGYSTPAERPNSHYPIYFNPRTGKIRLEDRPGYVKIHPIDSRGDLRVWRKTPPSLQAHIDNGDIQVKETRGGGYKVYIKDRIKSGIRPKSVWTGSKYDASSHGTKLLGNMFGSRASFSYPKSINTVFDNVWVAVKDKKEAVVMDLFAGSGTTGHAVIDLNNNDGGNRKYTLIEMGEHFNTALMPRIKKRIFSNDWADGKPTSTDTGISHCFKYIRLESYEDTLNNLVLKDRSKQQQDLLEAHAELREDYLLGYWLDVETSDSPSLLNIEQFEDPMNYKLNIAIGSMGVTKPTRVDLVETFNYLLGLSVRHIDTVSGFKVVTGINPNDESVLVIWRNINEKDNATLEEFLVKSGYNPKDTEYDYIYVNGEHTLEDPHFKVKMIEIEFKRLMFDV